MSVIVSSRLQNNKSSLFPAQWVGDLQYTDLGNHDPTSSTGALRLRAGVSLGMRGQFQDSREGDEAPAE